MQAIYNTTHDTITIKPAAPVDAGTFARLKNAGFAWAKDSGAFVASPAGELARGVAADIAGHIETRDEVPKKPAARADYNGATLHHFPRVELFIQQPTSGKDTVFHSLALVLNPGASEVCNTSAFKPAGWQEDESMPAENIAAIESDTTPAELCDDIERATYSPEDNKIRLYPVRRLDPAIYAQVKAAGFSWAPKQGVFVAPMWTPARADLAESLAGELEDEDSTLAERAEQRAERFENYQGKRASEADRARAAVSAIAEHIPFGQPILIGHHSERRARRDAQRIEDGMRRAVKMWETAEYWERRAAGAIRHAKYKELPAVRARRIKTIEASQRKTQKSMDQAEKFRAAWHADGLKPGAALKIANYDYVSRCYPLADYPRNPPASQYEGSMGLWSALDGGVIQPHQAREIAIIAHARTIAHCRRWLDHYQNRLAYERAMLADAGGLESDRVKPEKGGAIRCLWAPRGGLAWIVKVNTVTVSILHNYGHGGRNFRHNVPLDKIREVMSAADVEAARAAGRLIETDDKTGFYLAAPKPEDSAPADTVQASGEAESVQASGEENDDGESVQASRADYLFTVGTVKLCAFTEQSRRGARIWGVKVLENGRAINAADGAGAWFKNDTRARMIEDLERAYIAAMKHGDTAANENRWRENFGLSPITPTTAGEDDSAQNIAAIPEPTPTPAADPGAAFAAMRASLAAGVQVVSAPQLFPTPASLAARMVDLAEITPGARVLEPSAGTGRLLRAMPRDCVKVAIEINRELMNSTARALRELDILPDRFIAADFLSLCAADLGSFDRVLMNPPFINGADIKHIEHAAGLLKPGGRLVALCANGPRQRAALMPRADYWEDLPAGTFGESGTDVRAALLVINAPDASGGDDDADKQPDVTPSGEENHATPSGEENHSTPATPYAGTFSALDTAGDAIKDQPAGAWALAIEVKTLFEADRAARNNVCFSLGGGKWTCGDTLGTIPAAIKNSIQIAHNNFGLDLSAISTHPAALAAAPAVQASGEAWRAPDFDPTTASGYAHIIGQPAALEWWQDDLDSFFGSRLVAVRNALRALGWGGGIYPAPAWPLTHGTGGAACRLVVDLQHVGAGRNVVAVSWRALDSGGAVLLQLGDDLSHDAAGLAAAIHAHTQALASAHAAPMVDDDSDPGELAELAALDMTPDQVQALDAAAFGALYDTLEDINAHSYCAVLDAKQRGSAADVAEALAILTAHNEAGGLSMDLTTRRNRLADKLRQPAAAAAEADPTSGEAKTVQASGEARATPDTYTAPAYPSDSNARELVKAVEKVDLLRRFDYLKPATDNKLVSAAKNIRIELKRAWPGLKFSVTSERFSMGDAIRIHWTDGPTTRQVDAIANKYKAGSFDGMDDIYNYTDSGFNKLFGDAKYTSTSRQNSDAAIVAALATVARKFGAAPLSLEAYRAGGAWQWQTHDGHRLDREVHSALSEADYSLAPADQASGEAAAV